jgi:adenylate cyclase
MPDLIAQGPQPEHRWRRKLVPGAKQAIGRQAGVWSTPWDDRISRRHVEVEFVNGQLRVTALEAARNPVFFGGQSVRQFTLEPGEHFVIGETTFSFVDQRVNVSLDLPRPAGERTFSVEELRAQPFLEANKRIDVLSRLPDIISGSSNDQELFVRLVNLLLNGIERATAAALVAAGSHSADMPIEVLHWDRRILAEKEFRPSERLIRQAVSCGESVAHVWSGGQTEGEFTLSEGIDWALCTPVPGKACAGWALYVTGGFSTDFGAAPRDAELLRDDVKFAELMAATLSGLRESQILTARHASLSHFFSPIVLEAIGNQDPERVLAPREADVAVLFCDLRGFTTESERSADDLFGLLARVSQALGVMTHHILEHGGVVGDFHGDAAMGFWGWPIAQPDAVERACRAALGIRWAFMEDRSGHRPEGLVAERTASEAISPSPAFDFRVGIGIASGRAVAGKIGTIDQVKVTAFGPVVNLASRLETMTRQLQASILIDPASAAVIRASVPSSICRVRRLARVRPVGLASPIEVHELLPSAAECPEVSDEHLAAYESALAAFENRDWPKALKLLHAVPPHDLAKDFITHFITQHSRISPPNWDGSIPLAAK